MNARTISRILALAAAATLLTSAAALAGETTKQPEMSPEEAAAMAAMQAAMTPGEAHAKLEPLVGKWTTSNKFWTAPNTEPQLATGTSTHRWIMGGRYVEQAYEGEWMGMHFEGLGITGYDNVQERYVGTWLDNMSTGMMPSVGDANEAGTVFTFHADSWDPISGKPVHFREIIRIENENRHVMEMHATDIATGTEFKMMEIVYSRMPAAASGQ